MPETRLQKRQRRETGHNARDFQFYDFAKNHGRHWDLLKQLMTRLEETQDCVGFWYNRENILMHLESLIVVVRNDSPCDIVGFVKRMDWEWSGTGFMIDLFQVFPQRQGYGTMIVEHLMEVHKRVHVYSVLEDAEPFWKQMHKRFGLTFG